MKWKFDPKPSASAQGVACCDVVNRGAAYADGRLFINTLDAQTIAVDAATGRELWRTKLGDINRGETITMAPLVVKGKVLVGNSGGEFGVRGWLTALDAATGQIAWRAYSTGPDKDVLIGAAVQAVLRAGPRQATSASRPGRGTSWKIGGGTAWGWVSYDPELDLIYYGTGNPGPWNPGAAPGRQQVDLGHLRARPDTGEAVWFYQWSPHDLHDYDGVNENVLVDLPIGGRQRARCIVHPDRNGYVYVLDRATGRCCRPIPSCRSRPRPGVDLKTGALKYNPQKDPRSGETVRDICPAAPGGKDWQPSAWSPRTRPALHPAPEPVPGRRGVPGELHRRHAVRRRRRQDVRRARAATAASSPPGIRSRARRSGRSRRTSRSGAAPSSPPATSSSTARWTAGSRRSMRKTGALLWQFKTSSGIIGQPISYRGPDGKQYVAVLAGVGGWAGAIVARRLDPRDATAALGFVNAMKDLPLRDQEGRHAVCLRLP